MTIVEELKELAAAMKGTGTGKDIPGETVSDVIKWMKDNWADIKAAIKSE